MGRNLFWTTSLHTPLYTSEQHAVENREMARRYRQHRIQALTDLGVRVTGTIHDHDLQGQPIVRLTLAITPLQMHKLGYQASGIAGALQSHFGFPRQEARQTARRMQDLLGGEAKSLRESTRWGLRQAPFLTLELMIRDPERFENTLARTDLLEALQSRHPELREMALRALRVMD